MPVVALYGLGARLWDTHSGFYVDIFTWKPYGWVLTDGVAAYHDDETGGGGDFLDSPFPFQGMRNSHISMHVSTVTVRGDRRR
jgi:hypothetical protein